MKGLAAISAGLKAEALAKDASNAFGALQQGNLKDVGSTRIQATIGSTKSQSNSQSDSEQSQASTIQAANNLAIIATGAVAKTVISTSMPVTSASLIMLSLKQTMT